MTFLPVLSLLPMGDLVLVAVVLPVVSFSALPRNCEADKSSSCGCLDERAPRTTALRRSFWDIVDVEFSSEASLEPGGRIWRSSDGFSLTMLFKAIADFACVWLRSKRELASGAVI